MEGIDSLSAGELERCSVPYQEAVALNRVPESEFDAGMDIENRRMAGSSYTYYDGP